MSADSISLHRSTGKSSSFDIDSDSGMAGRPGIAPATSVIDTGGWVGGWMGGGSGGCFMVFFGQLPAEVL